MSAEAKAKSPSIVRRMERVNTLVELVMIVVFRQVAENQARTLKTAQEL